MKVAAPQIEELRIARADDDPSHWDAYVRSAPGAEHAHLWGWGRIAAGVLGREFIPLVAVTRDGEWQGVLPLVRIRVPLLAHTLVSMPYVNYGGALGTPAAQRVLLGAAMEEAMRSGARVLQIRSREATEPSANVRSRKTAVLLDLPARAGELWDRFPAKLRSQVRRPMKEGMEFRTGADQLVPFYRVFARNMRDLGTPVYPLSFFRAIADEFPDAVFGVIYHRGEPVGGGAGFVWRDEFEMTWASCVREYNPLAPNMLLYWRFMESMIERGVGTFNFGRCTPGSSTHRFKRQWGGRDVPLPWLEWSRREASSAGPSRGARLASSLWRRMPLPLANRMGPVLASRLPWW